MAQRENRSDDTEVGTDAGSDTSADTDTDTGTGTDTSGETSMGTGADTEASPDPDSGADTDDGDEGEWIDGADPPPAPDLSEEECEALHNVELGVEWLHRAHGNLVEFHHKTGHAMDHLAEAESQLRACGHTDLADALRDEYLPRGVIDEDRWSYDVLETYQDVFLSDLTAFEEQAREAIADGERHVAERRQEREWKRRAREE